MRGLNTRLKKGYVNSGRQMGGPVLCFYLLALIHMFICFEIYSFVYLFSEFSWSFKQKV